MWKIVVRTAPLLILLAAETTLALPQDPSVAVVDSAGRVGSHVALVTGSDGLPLLAYFDETLGDLKIAKCHDPYCSGRVSIATLDSQDRVGSYISLAIDGDGLPVIGYFDATSGDLKVARCGTQDCSSETVFSSVDSDGIVGLFSSMAMGEDGLPVISYFDRDKCDLKVAKCVDPACSGDEVVVSTVDKKGCVGLFTSIAVPADGLPVITYYDSNRGRLKIAKCNDPACTGRNETISVVDESVSAGSFAKVAIGADDLPVISYYNHSDGDLKMAHCNDPACAGGDESITTVDTDGLVGAFTALAFSEDGLPVVAYYDLTLGQVKLVQCRDHACTGFETPTVVADEDEILKSFLAMTISPEGTPVIAFFNHTDGDLKVVSVPLGSSSP